MKFPSFPQYLQAFVIAVIIAVAGYMLFPLLGFEDTTEATRKLFVLTMAATAFIAASLGAIRLEAGTGTRAPESGENMTIFVGNLAFKASQDDLRELFAPFGTVRSVRIMKDRATRRPRGFAFVEMDSAHAAAAIKALDGKEFLGRNLRVNEGVERNQKAA